MAWWAWLLLALGAWFLVSLLVGLLLAASLGTRTQREG
jgi:hypothetical protein